MPIITIWGLVFLFAFSSFRSISALGMIFAAYLKYQDVYKRQEIILKGLVLFALQCLLRKSLIPCHPNDNGNVNHHHDDRNWAFNQFNIHWAVSYTHLVKRCVIKYVK